MIKRLKNFLFTNSSDYWEDRYSVKGNSGAGSYGRLAYFKADVLNNFVKNNKVKNVLEFGCGDGNQLQLYHFNKYTGLDVSKTIIKENIIKYKGDRNKSFFLYDSLCFNDNNNIFTSDLTLSIDVIYHLVEDDIFEKYMFDLFDTSSKYVIIYSSDYNSKQQKHVRHRKFTEWIDNNIQGFKQIDHIKNIYPYSDECKVDTSPADFFIYRRWEENQWK